MERTAEGRHNNPYSAVELESFHIPKEDFQTQTHNDFQRDESNPLCRSNSTFMPGSPQQSDKSIHQRRPSRALALVAIEKLRNRPKKLRKALIANILRWFASALFVVAIYVVLWHYANLAIMSTPTKREFNALIIGLSLGLGMSITISLEAMAVEIRYWIISLRDWPDRETELILKAKDLTKIIQLTWVSKSRTLRSYAVAFIILNLISQIALAMLGLVYSTNTADSTAILHPGNVTIADMSNIVTNNILSKGSKNNSQALGALRYTANSYGTIALGVVWGTYSDIPKPGSLWDNSDPSIFINGKSCKYVFQETASRPKTYDLVVTTNRSVEATGYCQSWRVLKGGDGNLMTITIDDDKKTQVNITAANGVNQTTFMFDAAGPQGETWSEVTAFEASSSDPWFYRCNVTVAPVVNAMRKEHYIGTNITSLATSAIALQGYGASSLGPTNSDQQFQSYPAESTYGMPVNGSTEDMGQTMASFTIGVIAVTAQPPDGISVPGMRPQQGVVLQITKWMYVHLILGLSLGLQLLLGVGIAILSNLPSR
ncbi:hypothetical protein FBEOM_8264 [Fusarium beomiforme]|uniref:Uncharacterized protein n=1 Tax=Fusarium beomiforme TaxID=44412 RepID=A0A9P5AFR2_9HYPO|nr:hypothetical protein FBEOM_8264 [Fusarium beomiforme]